MQKICQAIRLFWRERSGATLAETIVVLPVMIVFMAGILEFSGFLYTKLQVETGLKDAARYMARCQSGTRPCDSAKAQKIAVFGNPAGTGGKRAWGWSEGAVSVDSPLPGTEVVQVSTSFSYPGSPLIQVIGLNGLTISARHQERLIGF